MPQKGKTMKTVKINYCTPYTDETVCGYVKAIDHGDYYTITRKQYKDALKKMSIGNVGPKFLSGNKPVYMAEE